MRKPYEATADREASDEARAEKGRAIGESSEELKSRLREVELALDKEELAACVENMVFFNVG